MKTVFNILFITAVTASLFSACKKDEQSVTAPVPGNEFTTTVKIRFENIADPTDTTWAVWQDLMPEDSNPPDTSKAIINLRTGKTYHAAVHFYDETKSPAEDLTLEVQERANYHLYVFKKQGAITDHLSITVTDHDSNTPPLPLGLKSDFATDTVPCSGRLEGILRHQPNGKDGTLVPGSTDSDVFFRVNITN